MRTPSRRMPGSPRPVLPWPIAIFALALIALLLALPVTVSAGWIAGTLFAGFVLGTVATVTVLAAIADGKRLGTLAAERPGESICTFARSFDRRTVDTWILRAVYEELQPYGEFGGVTMPLRASDDLEEVLGIDAEELETLVEDIAHRACRSLDRYDRNPFYGRITTVGDLVWFFENQPLKNVPSAL